MLVHADGWLALPHPVCMPVVAGLGWRYDDDLVAGTFTSMSYVPERDQVLVSVRPSEKHPHVRHLVCVLHLISVCRSSILFLLVDEYTYWYVYF